MYEHVDFSTVELFGGVTQFQSLYSLLVRFYFSISLSNRDADSFITKPEAMDVPQKQDNHHVLSLLQSLKKASQDLQINPITNILNQQDSKPAIEALLELQTKVDAVAIVSSDPILLSLSELLTDIKKLSEKLKKIQGYDLTSLIRRQIAKFKIFQVACSIDAKINSYVDQEIVVNLVMTFIKSKDEDEKVKALIVFGNRLSRGFDSDFQELILRGRVFHVIEFIICGDSNCSKRVRNQACVIVLGLVKFNRDVFVGLVLMSPIISALISISSLCSMHVLYFLITFVGSPLVDEIAADGEIPRIISLLRSEDKQVRVAAMHSVFEMAFVGTREVIEKMLREDLVKKLMALQRTELEVECGSIGIEFLKWSSAFANCVARFAEQIQVGEGLQKRDKREFRDDILRSVRAAAVSDAEAATVFAEVLWVHQQI